MNRHLRERVRASLVATVGYLLSPLSWWNDLYVNVPIAYGLAWLVSLLDRRLLGASMIFFYWITNLVGLLLLHKGLESVAKGDSVAIALRKRVLLDIFLSIAYSGILALLVYTRVLRFPADYFTR